MNSRRLVRIAASSICAMVLVCAAAAASAQTVYRQVDDDGHVMFSDQPAAQPAAPRRAGARQVEAKEADRRLKQAKLERARGVEPQPGELTQGNGARAVNYRYWRRQEKLRLLVEQAQRRTSETGPPQLASR
jgi:hypothetical protein